METNNKENENHTEGFNRECETQININKEIIMEKIASKRLSNASDSTTCSSSNNSILTTVSQKRGRKPTLKVEGSKKRLKFMQEEKQESLSDLIYFGNKLVKKDTDEYMKRRNKNNEAVKKFRKKLHHEELLKEEKMKRLTDENVQLNGKIQLLSKQLDILKKVLTRLTH